MENIETDDTHIQNTSQNDIRVIESKLQHFNISRIGWIMTGVVTLLFIIYFALYQSSTDNTSASTSGSETSYTYIVHIIIFLIIVYLVYIYINSSTMEYVDTEIKEIIDPIKNLVREKQVFHIPSNTYTYTDAKAVCSAYNSELATYNEISDAFGKGADWCSYGWSEGQMAFFPTQEEKWNDLQKVKGHEHDCGRPGINLSRNDPNLLYGVNCYGIKPEPKGNEKVKQAILSDKQRDLEAKIAQFQKNVNASGVAPFNVNKWSI